MATNPIPFLTQAQYLEIEDQAPTRSELIDGVMYAMSGASPAHSLLTARAITTLTNRLAARGCSVFNNDIKVAPNAEANCYYPDVTVVCGEPVYLSLTAGLLANPLLIVEVLSKSTEGYDRGDKFENYRRISSLREYVLVSQSRIHVEVFSRGVDAKWSLVEFTGIDDVCHLATVDCDIPLRELYERIPLTGSEQATS